MAGKIDDFESIRKGDLKAYERFFKGHYAEIVRFSYRFVRSQQIAEEISQEVFMYIWEKRDTIQIQSSLRSYLYSAAKNRSINYLKLELPKTQAQRDISELEIGFEVPPPQDDGRAEYVTKRVQQAVDALPKKCREIFILSRNAGLTYDEIAEELDISKKTVENQMGIALKKLREALKPLLKAIND
ncbi:MAG: RNA polymerase sigma-70 factor [Bacteroidota bacterium]